MVNIILGTENKIVKYIRDNGKKIYLWGSGVMLQICMYDMLKRNQLIDFVISCTESDNSKIGKNLLLGNKRIPIINFESMVKDISNRRNVLIVITCSYYYQILQKLDCESLLDNIDCLCLPMMYLEHLSSDELENINWNKREKIPKKIHYCWFGEKQISQKNVKCIESWKEKCPDYEILCWDESNIDWHMSSWVEKAYQKKQWAYVSDYVRAWVLYNYGGYYFDVDVELKKNLNDFSTMEAFGCFEKWPVINTGGGCGSIPGFWLWKEIMELKDKVSVEETELVFPNASGYYDTLPLLNRGMQANGKLQNIDGFICLPYDYFQPIDYVTQKSQISNNTYGIHYFNWSWANDVMREGNPVEQDYYKKSLNRAKRIENL